MNKKKVIIVFCLIIIVIISIVLIFNNRKNNNSIDGFPTIEGNENVEIKEDGTKENKSNKISEEKGYDSYKISDTTLTYDSGKTTFKANIKNVSKGDLKGHLVDIILLNKKGEVVSKISTYIKELKIDESVELNASISKDVVNAYDYKIVRK